MKLLKLYGHVRGRPSSLPRRHDTQGTDREPPSPSLLSPTYTSLPPHYLIEGEVRLPISTAPGLRGKYGGVFWSWSSPLLPRVSLAHSKFPLPPPPHELSPSHPYISWLYCFFLWIIVSNTSHVVEVLTYSVHYCGSQADYPSRQNFRRSRGVVSWKL
jgi:hypothetical protein